VGYCHFHICRGYLWETLRMGPLVFALHTDLCPPRDPPYGIEFPHLGKPERTLQFASSIEVEVALIHAGLRWLSVIVYTGNMLITS
jgi:hypothetical protein